MNFERIALSSFMMFFLGICFWEKAMDQSIPSISASESFYKEIGAELPERFRELVAEIKEDLRKDKNIKPIVFGGANKELKKYLCRHIANVCGLSFIQVQKIEEIAYFMDKTPCFFDGTSAKQSRSKTLIVVDSAEILFASYKFLGIKNSLAEQQQVKSFRRECAKH